MRDGTRAGAGRYLAALNSLFTRLRSVWPGFWGGGRLMSIIRNCAAWLAIGALILLSPLAALLIVMSAEMVVDLVAQVGMAGMLDVMLAGAIGCVLFRRISTRQKMEFQLGAEPVGDETAIGVPPA